MNKNRRATTIRAKKKLTFFLDPRIIKQIDTEARELRLSRQQIMESAIKERYSPEAHEERDAQIVRRLNRLDNRQKAIEHDLLIIAEIQRLFVRMWLSTSIEVPASQKEALQAEGQKRYERFMESLLKRIKSGQSILDELPTERVLKDDSFSSS